MPSIRSRLFSFALRHQHVLHGQLRRRSMVDWETSIPDLRKETEGKAGIFGNTPKDYSAETVRIGDLSAEWIAPPQGNTGKVLFYLHGGGYVLGSAKMHRGIVVKPLAETGATALVIDYRLAPEHPFPAALDDALTAYAWLLEQGIPASDIVCMGDSAGGGLCLALLLALKEKQIPLPAGAVALSPWTDLKNTGDSFERNAARDTLCWKEAQTVFSAYYTDGKDPGKPLISPLYGDLEGLPPLLLYVGSDELLLDDATRFAEKARKAGVAVRLHIGQGLFHCYPVCSPLFPEAKKAMQEIRAFIRTRLAESQAKD